ncbi:hypothetical protein WA158_002638 [Blastocystis sp. Blastoise]
MNCFSIVFLFLISIVSAVTKNGEQQINYFSLNKVPLDETDEDKRRLSDSFYKAPTFGSVLRLGYYYAIGYIGTPPQRTTLIIDTGSHLTATPCSDCRDCGTHLSKPFDPLLSRSKEVITCNHPNNSLKCNACKSNQCVITQHYAEHSLLSGVLYSDKMFLGGNIYIHNSSIPVGNLESLEQYSVYNEFICINQYTKLFKTQLADGILGLSATRNSYITHLFASRSIYPSFSLCFKEDSGIIAFGGQDTTLNQSPMCSVPIHYHNYQYTVEVTRIAWNNVKVPVLNERYFFTSNPLHIDSGTSFTYIPNSIFPAFIHVFKSISEILNAPIQNEQTLMGEEFCVSMDQSSLDLFPILYIYLTNNCSIHVSPRNYFYYRRQERVWCISIARDQVFLLGNNFMIGHHYYFDIKQNKLGIAESNCYKSEISAQDIYDMTTPYSDKPSSYSPSPSNNTINSKLVGHLDPIPMNINASVQYTKDLEFLNKNTTYNITISDTLLHDYLRGGTIYNRFTISSFVTSIYSSITGFGSYLYNTLLKVPVHNNYKTLFICSSRDCTKYFY